MDICKHHICMVYITSQVIVEDDWGSKVCRRRGDIVSNETITAAWGNCVGVWGRKSSKKVCVFF